ncbi:hypothetical protein OEZ85_005950 [Tetradesmus obliquus]|uniref:Helicase C-terminal domain-containing protein n=1 Tax=Tetradesmus obliquus TaxID=3088 RepID=A0ABY8UI80_TETOB|nr:hypothetical protein OEZ85_005950 [Tetradesmus obliquus]
MRLNVLQHCLLGAQHALSAFPATQSAQILDAWLKPLVEEAAWELSRGLAEAAARAKGLADWLADAAQRVKVAENPSSEQLADSLKAAAKQLHNMRNSARTSLALREGVCKMLTSNNTSDTNASGWPAHQRQLDAWLAAFAAAYEAEQQLLGEEGAWPNIAAAVVEPTGAGKTGIINLAAFAALGPSAPPGSACKVLVVTPNIVIAEAVLEYFAAAAKVLLTATPFRGDGADLPPRALFGGDALRIKERIREGLISNMAYAPVPVSSVQVAEAGSHTAQTYSGSQQLQQLSERLDIQDMSLRNQEVRKSTMRYSMQLAQKLRDASGERHTIIAQAVDTEDADLLWQEWTELSQQEFGGRFTVDRTHTGRGLTAQHREDVKERAKAGLLDVVIHVGQLGEGFDAPALSVVAVFRVFRNMAPFMQLLGRAARRIKDSHTGQPIPASHPANIAFLVAHPLLGYHKHWSIYKAERQDDAGELKARGRASNLRLLSFTYPPAGTSSSRESAAAGTESAASGRFGAGMGQAAGLQGTGRDTAAVKADLAAALQSMLTGGGKLQLDKLTQMRQELSAPAARLPELRKVKDDMAPWLDHVGTSGAGRTVDVVRRDMLQALSELIALQAAAA